MKAGETVSGVDHVTSVDVNVDPFDTVGSFGGTIADLDAFGIGFAGRIWAVQFPAQELLDVLDQGLVFKSAAFRTFLFDASVAAIYPQAGLVTGVAEGGFATLDIADPIVRQRDFFGQQNDFSQLFFSDPAEVAEEIREAVEEGLSDFFLILELPEEILGASGFSPAIGLDAGQQAGLLGRSYLSNDFGATGRGSSPPAAASAAKGHRAGSLILRRCLSR